MSNLRKNAAAAKSMLGKTGTLNRVAALATIYKGDVRPDDWVVETFDSTGDGGLYVTVFGGPFAKERAIEYATEKYSGFRLRIPDQR